MATGIQPDGSGSASRRSRNTMRVKPYAIRFPSRNARHTALSAPGGRMSTSGCSCWYRSSLRTCSAGPGGTSCTGQYRYRARGQRNGFPQSPPTRPRGRARTHGKYRHHLRICSRCQAAPHISPVSWPPPGAGQAAPGTDQVRASLPSCRNEYLIRAQIYVRSGILTHTPSLAGDYCLSHYLAPESAIRARHRHRHRGVYLARSPSLGECSQRCHLAG